MAERRSTSARQWVLLLLVPAGLALAQWAVTRPAVDLPRRIGLEEARATGGVLWVDARSRSRYDAGHVPGALPLNLAEWESLLPAVVEAWTPERPVVVYCERRGCDDSTGVARRLKRDLGADDVRVLSRGLAAWREAGLPLASGKGGRDGGR